MAGKLLLQPKRSKEIPFEEERKRILAEKGRAKVYQRLDQASRIYLLMTNFYPEPLVELVSCHVDFPPYTEDKAIGLFKELLETILVDLTEGWKHMEKLEPYVKETLAWR